MRLLIMLLIVAGFLAGSLPVAFDAEAGAGSKSKDEVQKPDDDEDEDSG
ncbi:MAG: hypothetical protein O7A65_10255 [Proteobacteria bacterium]|nr:hypothetical protein [Pseudomonadota bacterium]